MHVLRLLREAFPEFATHPLGYLDRIFNRWLGVAVVILNYILLITCDKKLDFVLNSTAAFFIIELDDVAVFLDADGITDLYRRLLLKELRTNLKEIDDELYFKEGWEGGGDGQELVLDEDACEVVRPRVAGSPCRYSESSPRDVTPLQNQV